MHQRKIKDDPNCGITIAMRVFGAKWKPCIIDAIASGSTRPSQIHKRIPEATPRVLDMQLSQLHDVGVVTRKTAEGFPLSTEYRLSTLGESILPIVRQLDIWGLSNIETLRRPLSLTQVNQVGPLSQ